MEKNIVEVVMNNKGEVVEKVADYIGVFSFAKTIEALYRECLEDCDNPEDIEEYIADLSMDYPKHRTGTFWVSEYDGPVEEYFNLYPQMVARLDAADDSEQADEDRAYLMDWYFDAFGTYNIKYNFSNWLSEIVYMREEEQAIA